MPDTITITVNGRPVEAVTGTLLLTTLREAGIHVPTLCHDDRLAPYGGCRLCVVHRRDGRGGLVPACSTPVENGMVVDTDTQDVIESRRRQLQLLILNHRMECPVCEQRGDCGLQDLVFRYGSPEELLPFNRVSWPRDEASPLIVRDNEKCVLCGKCVRLCEEVQNVSAIGIVKRGLDAHVATWLDGPLDCEFCGQCVDACPVAALTARPFASEVPAWQRTRTVTTCSYCSCGCELEVESHDGALLRVRSAENARPNRGKLCVKGRFGWDLLRRPERLTRPLLRRDGRLVEVSWEEALDAVVAALGAARSAGRAVVGLATPRMSLEDAYLFQRFLRSAVGTPHVDCGPGRGVRALVDGVRPVLGEARSTADFADLAAADTVIVLRADPTRTHPLVKTEIVEAVRRRGQRLVLAHAVSGELDALAARTVNLQPGGEVALLYGVARVLLADAATAARAAKVAGFDGWRQAVERLDAGHLQEAGVSSGDVMALAELVAAARRLVVVVVTGHGIPGDEAAVARAAAELLLASGHAGRAGSGVLVLGEKANAQGVVEAGMQPSLLPGGRDAADVAHQRHCSALWGAQVPAGPGWPAREAMQRAAAEEVGVLYLAGRDPVDVWPHTMSARGALEGADFVVVQDAFLSETAKAADVVLPVAVLIEREGSLIGADGVRRALRRAVAPPARLPGDGEVFVEIARRLGVQLPTGQALAAEIGALLGERPTPAAPRFGLPEIPVVTRLAGDLLLDASPQLFHSGSTTRWSPTLQELAPSVAVRISPHDADRLAIANGETVRLASGDKEVLLRARIDGRIRPGRVVALWSSSGEGIGLLASDETPAAVELRRSR